MTGQGRGTAGLFRENVLKEVVDRIDEEAMRSKKHSRSGDSSYATVLFRWHPFCSVIENDWLELSLRSEIRVSTMVLAAVL